MDASSSRVENRGKKEVYLFQRMETERAKIPNMVVEEYLPIFIVKSLRERLVPDEGVKENSGEFGSSNKMFIPFAKATETEDSMWTDDTFLEQNLDFEGAFFLSEENLNYVGKVLRFAKNAIECFGVNRNEFGRLFTDDFEYPCLELLYLMDSVYCLLPLNNYLFWLKEQSQINYFKQQFLSFCFSTVAFSEESHETSNRILRRFLQCIILSHYCNPCSKQSLQKLKDFSGEILKQITAKLICKDSSSNHKTILAILKDVDIPSSVGRRYASEHIDILLRSGSKPFRAEMEILQFQEKYADPTLPMKWETLTLTMSHMVSGLRSSDILEIISSTLTLASQDFNWEKLLYFVTLWVQEKQNAASSMLKDLSKTFIQNGLRSKRECDVMKGFIIARHCSVIASETFSRYEKWFTNLFTGENYSVAKEPEDFRFLVETLTEWIPIEPSCFLHVHTTFWPFIPKGCRDLWSDYLAIAKVRISEYKEVEEAMEYEPNPNDPIQHEVGMATKKFESTGTIPLSIIQMSNFSRQHYLNEFLPALLRKPTNVTLSDSRLRLIEILNQKKKIPDKMYQAYKLGA